MSLRWMSWPSVEISRQPKEGAESPVDAPHGLAHESCGYSAGPAGVSSANRHGGVEAEALAAAPLRHLIDRLDENSKPQMLVDCRSMPMVGAVAPTYNLAGRVGLRRALVWSLGGGAGTEFPQAMVFLRAMGQRAPTSAALVITQVVSPPQYRHGRGGAPLGDASVAVLLAARRGSSTLEILGGAVGQSRDVPDALGDAIRRATGGVDTLGQISWWIGHAGSSRMTEEVKAIAPQASRVLRSESKDRDFGCADPLVTLALARPVLENYPGETGLLVFEGLFGSIGVIMVRVKENNS